MPDLTDKTELVSCWDVTGDRLRMLKGPHGATMARAWLVRQTND